MTCSMSSALDIFFSNGGAVPYQNCDCRAFLIFRTIFLEVRRCKNVNSRLLGYLHQRATRKYTSLLCCPPKIPNVYVYIYIYIYIYRAETKERRILQHWAVMDYVLACFVKDWFFNRHECAKKKKEYDSQCAAIKEYAKHTVTHLRNGLT